MKLRLVAVLGVTGAVLVWSLAQPTGLPDPQKIWALVIGVSNYTHAERLKFAALDAQAISDFVTSPRGRGVPPDHTFTLLEDKATRRGVEVELEAMQERVQDGDTVYIYIAGHGFVTNRGIGYFIPSDGDLRSPASTAVSFTNLKELVDVGLAHAARRVLVTDMCNAGRIGPETTARAAAIQNVVNGELLKISGGAPGSFLNLLASRPTEASWESDELEQGIFTHALLSGLNGKAATAGATVVTAKALVDYVRTEVPRLTSNQQNPVANEAYDPQMPLSMLDKPAPPPRVAGTGTILEIVNADKSAFSRVQWLDPKTSSVAVRQLPRDGSKVEIPSLLPGELALTFYDSENRERKVPVKLERGKNTLDVASRLGRNLLRPRVWTQTASLAPPALPASSAPPAQLAARIASTATLLMRPLTGTQVFVDGAFFGNSAGATRFLQLQGLSPGVHRVTLIPNPEREQRFRVNLFSGPQILDIETGELRAVAEIEPPPEQLTAPPELPPSLADVYRRFQQALWEERLVEPVGNSAWDYYQQLQPALPATLRDKLKNRLIVAMGNLAQRTVLKYLRGGDIRWNALVFEQGTTLLQRTQQLFKASNAFESQERFFAGRALIERGQYSQAVRELQQAVALDAEASHAFNALGLAFWKQNLLDQAIPPLQQAMALSPRWTYPRNTLALIYFEQRRYPEAEQNFQSSTQLDSEDSTAYHGLGQLYSLLGRWQEAEAQLQRAIDVNPGNAYAHETLGRLHQHQQRRDQAEQMFRLAIRLEPDEPSFRISLGQLLQQVGRAGEAQQIFADLAAGNPNNPQVLVASADFWVAQKRFSDARKLYQQAFKLSPGDPNLRISYGLALQSQGRFDDAVKEYKTAARMAPANPYAHYNLADVYVRQKKISDAEKELALAVKADPRFSKPLQLLGRIRFSQKRYQEALAEYRKALALAIEAAQKQEIEEDIATAESALSGSRIEEAKEKTDKGDYAEAWNVFVSRLKLTPEDRSLRDSILEFQAQHPADANAALLPPSLLADVLKTKFWQEQMRAETLWRAGSKPVALETFAGALESLSQGERLKVTSTGFNLRNERFGVHALVYQWGRRLVDERHYQQALGLMETSLRHKIFGVNPLVSQVTIADFLAPPDNPDPQLFKDFDTPHYPDRRAHEIYATAYAGAGDLAKVREYLGALERDGPDVEMRRRIAEILRRENRPAEAEAILKP